ncbi:MAG: archaemetzincin [Chloroflexi bacterium]|nr:archaemetzincin [Chloroflexota bacterium]MCI0644912.1 archaemetzincin [Chloroflexota bacterium]
MAGFSPPSPAARRQTLGPTDDLPPALQHAFEPAGHFQRLPASGPNDWLANHPEPGQTFAGFLAEKAFRPDKTRHTIYLQPLNAFPAGKASPLDQLRAFAAAFFALPVEVLPVLVPDAGEVTTRRNPYTGQRQLLTRDILFLLRKRLPADAFCLLGITVQDLYPDPDWNFVFGQAAPRLRVGVYSFARYLPSLHGEQVADAATLALRRSCKVLAHEAAHLFGPGHCIYFHCLMNGSNHLAESDSRPLHLCPVDLRKLHHSIGFDVVERYRRLLHFSQAAGFTDEVAWLEERLAYLSQTA